MMRSDISVMMTAMTPLSARTIGAIMVHAMLTMRTIANHDRLRGRWHGKTDRGGGDKHQSNFLHWILQKDFVSQVTHHNASMATWFRVSNPRSHNCDKHNWNKFHCGRGLVLHGYNRGAESATKDDINDDRSKSRIGYAVTGRNAMTHILKRRMSAQIFAAMLTLACVSLMKSTPLQAQDVSADDAAPQEFTPPQDIDWSQLATDPASQINKPLKPGVKKTAPTSNDMSWKREDKPDGSSAVTVKQPIVPFWDTRIGADMSVVSKTPMTSNDALQEKLAHDNQIEQSSGSAWMAMTAPGLSFIWDKTSIEARMDPSQDQSKVGTSLEKTLPLAGDTALTLQNGYRVTQQSLTPIAGPVDRAARNYEIEQSAKFSLNTTGTSFIAGQSHSTADDKWLRRVGAEQKILEGVSITGAIAETPEGVADRSLKAGYKYRW